MSAFTGTHAPAIGVWAPARLADALRQLGMRVHTGETFRDAVGAIKAPFAADPFPIVLADTNDAGLSAWGTRTSSRASVVLLTSGPQRSTLAPTARVALPATVRDILAAAGVSPDRSHPMLDEVIVADWAGAEPAAAPEPPSVAAEPEPELRDEPSEPDEDPIGEDEPAAPRPRGSRSRTRHVVVDDDDDWLDAIPVAREDAADAEPAPAAADDDDLFAEPEPAPTEPVPAMPGATASVDDSIPGWMRDELAAVDASDREPEVEEIASSAPVPGHPQPSTSQDDLPDWMREELGETEPEPILVVEPIVVEDEPEETEETEPEESGEVQPVYPDEPLDSGDPEPDPVRREVPDLPLLPKTGGAFRAPRRSGSDEVDDGAPAAGPVRASERAKPLIPEIAIPEGRPQCPIIVSFASKGGVGKSTFALALAQTAAQTGMRVTLIDGNRGQGGVRVFLRVDDSAPSVYDAAMQGSVQPAFLKPGDIVQHQTRRSSQIPAPMFAAVLAPPDRLANPEVVTAHVYAAAVEFARSVSDLVVLDTQISERFDPTLIISQVAIPAMLSENGYGVGLTDGSTEGMANLKTRLDHFRSLGIPRERLLSVVNRMEDYDQRFIQLKRGEYEPVSRFLGIVGEDRDFQRQHALGAIAVDGTGLAPMIRRILEIATGSPAFAPVEEPPVRRRGGLFGFGRKGK